MSSLLVRTMVLVWTFPARRVTTVAQIYGWTPRRGGRQWRRGTASPVQDHLVMVYIGAGHPAPAKNRASMSVHRSHYGTDTCRPATGNGATARSRHDGRAQCGFVPFPRGGSAGGATQQRTRRVERDGTHGRPHRCRTLREGRRGP